MKTMADDMNTINRMLGEHEAAIGGMKDNHKRCSENTGNRLNSLDNEVRAIRVDMKGLQDQTAGSLETISDLEMQGKIHSEAILHIDKARSERWIIHDNACEKCRDHMQDVVKLVLEEYCSKSENMGLIALCKRYWYYALGLSVAFFFFFDIKTELLQFITKNIFHIK
jgi:hypothetical protein